MSYPDDDCCPKCGQISSDGYAHPECPKECQACGQLYTESVYCPSCTAERKPNCWVDAVKFCNDYTSIGLRREYLRDTLNEVLDRMDDFDESDSPDRAIAVIHRLLMSAFDHVGTIQMLMIHAKKAHSQRTGIYDD